MTGIARLESRIDEVAGDLGVDAVAEGRFTLDSRLHVPQSLCFVRGELCRVGTAHGREQGRIADVGARAATASRSPPTSRRIRRS